MFVVLFLRYTVTTSVACANERWTVESIKIVNENKYNNKLVIVFSTSESLKITIEYNNKTTF